VSEAAATTPGERVAKVIARAGVCSRRDAERLIADRRVAVDGRVLDQPGFNVLPGQRITVDGKVIPLAEAARLFRYHKPRGVVTTARDPEGRKTIYAHMPEGAPRLMPIGRLDLNSEGLLLLTNDGGLKRTLELPATGWLRRYRVRVFGHPSEPELRSLAAGVTIEGVTYGSVDAKLDRTQGDNAWLTVALREGRNREVRRVLEHIGLKVSRLIRTAYGPFQLGTLAERTLDEVRPKVLKDQLGSLLGDQPAPVPHHQRQGRGAGTPVRGKGPKP
jgi:23S rRNA pseudouridine2605 synthase